MEAGGRLTRRGMPRRYGVPMPRTAPAPVAGAATEDTMETWMWYAIGAAAVLVAIVVIAAAYMRSHASRSEQLRDQFGDEYDQAVNDLGGSNRAERELSSRKARVESLHIRELSAGNRQRFAQEWEHTQSRFVDDPAGAIRTADGLIGEVMHLRGYPVGDFETRSADLSVDHPAVVSNYRAAHGVSLKNDEGAATTEELRRAMVNYRELFLDLVGPTPAEAEPRSS